MNDNLVEAGGEMVLGLDFILHHDEPRGNSIPIKIMTGDYKGIVYHYNDINFLDDENDDTSILQFGYDIIDPLEFGVDDITKDPRFKQTIGDILRSLIAIIIEEKGDVNDSGTNNPERIDPQ